MAGEAGNLDETIIGYMNGLEQKIILEEEKDKPKIFLSQKYAFIDDEKVKFKYVSLVKEKLNILIPQDFNIMSDEIARFKYPNFNRPDIIYSNKQANINLIFSYLEKEVSDEQVEETKQSYQDGLLKNMPAASLLGSDTFNVSNHAVSCIEILTQAIDSFIYNLMFLLSIENRLCFGSFNCREIDMYDWKEVAKSMIETMEISC